MYFTNGDHEAFESLMWDKPGDHYDSGADGPFPECRSCRCHRPYRKDRYCKYAECPYTPGRAPFFDLHLRLGHIIIQLRYAAARAAVRRQRKRSGTI